MVIDTGCCESFSRSLGALKFEERCGAHLLRRQPLVKMVRQVRKLASLDTSLAEILVNAGSFHWLPCGAGGPRPAPAMVVLD
jgi:hypothetical protein